MALLVPALGLGTALAPITARSAVYLSVEQAQHDMFGTTPLQRFPVLLTSQQQDQLRDASSVSLPFRGDRVWKAADGGWFIVDEVVGKHEMITYAIAIGGDGAVRRVEVLEYRESYGQEVADAKWLRPVRWQERRVDIEAGQGHRQHLRRHAVVQAHHRWREAGGDHGRARAQARLIAIERTS